MVIDSICKGDTVQKELCLVSASGGLDSSLTLSILKLAGYKNIIACHFNYGHRGSLAEQIAIDNVCIELKIPLKIFNLKHIYDSMELEDISMLANKNAEITTGTANGLKTVAAWHCGRNMMFITTMATFAEAEVMKHNYEKVYLLGGFLNLSESGIYPDNSEYFLSSALEFFKYGTLIGRRIQPLFCLSNLMKNELFVLIKHLDLTRVYRHTISCDRACVETPVCDHVLINYIAPNSNNSVACNCMQNGIPACGSGLLSYWASKMVGMDDMKIRNFYEVPSNEPYEAYIPDHLKQGFKKNPDVNDIINRILLPEDKLDNLRKILNCKNKLL